MSDTISLTREEVAILLRAPNFEAYETVSKRLVAFDRSEHVPADKVLPPAVTGQMEIDPDVTAADMGINADPAPMDDVVSPPRWRVFEDITHGWWGIEENIFDGNTILYPKKLSREAVEGIVRAHNAALATATEGSGE